MSQNTVNAPNYRKDLTVRIFDNFYNFEVDVPTQEYDLVYSYFRSVMSTAQAAGNFAVSLFRVAAETNVPALTLLNAFKGSTGVALDATLAYYLNLVRSRATLLGVNASIAPNQFAARLVIQ